MFTDATVARLEWKLSDEHVVVLKHTQQQATPHHDTIEPTRNAPLYGLLEPS
jgi:hypothetical protein